MPLQLHQNINLFLLLVLGSYVAHISLGWVEIAYILSFTIVVEHVLLYLNSKREFYFSYSALSTAIGVIVLMYSAHLWIYFIVITLGLLQKHYLTLEGKQFFNPSNFAIIMALLFFYEDAHVITGQFGDEFWLGVLVFILAAIILIRVNRWVISVAFIVSYLLLQYMFVLSYDPVMTFEDISHRFYSVTFTLFIYFMLTDPSVTPNRWQMQMVFAFLVALGAVWLDRFYGFRVQHLFMSVFFFSLFITMLNSKQERKTWLTAALLFVSTIIIIVFIDSKPPYYFEMEG